MALIEISETQLAFGYLHSHMSVYKPRRFVLPSIRQEGGRVRFPFPGADVILNNNHLIQFKRPFYFTSNGIKEFWHYSKPSDIDPPYYRFYIKNDNPTNQLSKLVQATRSGLYAEYISPLFTNESDFFRLLSSHRTHLRAYAHIDISQFGGMLTTIGSNNDHTVIYTQQSVQNGYCYCFSEPKQIRAHISRDNFTYLESGKSFRALEIIDVINSIFFEEDLNRFESNNPFYQCLILQTRLFMEMDIIWTFNYTIAR
jgi:hypothetical protein